MATGVRGVAGQFNLETVNPDRVAKDFGRKVVMAHPRRRTRRGKK